MLIEIIAMKLPLPINILFNHNYIYVPFILYLLLILEILFDFPADNTVYNWITQMKITINSGKFW